MGSDVVNRDCCVSLAYVLFDERGQPVDSATPGEPLRYVHGYAQIVPGLERKLEGLPVGARIDDTFEPADAFGDFDEEGVFEVERSIFPADAELLVGDQFVAEGVAGEPIAMRVLEIDGDSIIVDTNHPLAGQRVRFEVEIAGIRAAEPTEIELAKKAKASFAMGRASRADLDKNGESDEQDR